MNVQPEWPRHWKSTLARRAFSGVLALLGAVLLLGGLRLIYVGGSWWYACSGVVLLISSVLLWRRNRWGGRLYGVLLAYTVVWSIWEAGFDAWALTSRLGTLALLGLWFLIPPGHYGWSTGPRFLPGGRRPFNARIGSWVWAIIALAGAAALGIAFMGFGRPVTAGSNALEATEAAVQGDWRNYGNDTDGTRYSQLGQLRPGNVSHLRLAWSFRTGDMPRAGQEYNFEATPLKVRNLLYTCTPSGEIYALDAATGKLSWHFDARGDLRGVTTFACRGVSYYASAAESGDCRERIYVATPDNKLWSIDALTGARCAAFGEGGAVDLLAGLGAVSKGTYAVTSPPLVTHGKVVVGARVEDNVSIDMPSGVVRAYDALTGALAWAWDVGRPERRGAPVYGDTYTRSTPNAWAPLVADDAGGLVYISTGNPAADFWGRKRRPFDENFGSSLVAVNVDSGETRWKFQITHHDVWDNDLGAQPVLVNLPTPQGVQRAVIVGSKQGNIFVLNRLTGAPIVPVSERPAPGPSNIGEKLSATQPESALAVNPGPVRLTEAQMWGITPIDQMWCRIQFRKARYEGPYTPPGTGRASLVYPGMFGGIEWGGVTVDPIRRILIANPTAMPFIVRMVPVNHSHGGSNPDGSRAAEGVATGLREVQGTGYAVSFFGFLSPLNIPCLQPPWGKLYAIDLNTRAVLWERPVGTARDAGPLGMATHLPLLIGTPQVGGTVVTRGGLIFTGATLDRYLRAYDLDTGRELWKARLPAGGQATPITYQVNGRQFVVIAAGGHGVLGTKAGDYLLAYALDTPEAAPPVVH
jgi:quinoprotein glucose dehydrogenase